MPARFDDGRETLEELRASLSDLRSREERFVLALDTAGIGTWDWFIDRDQLIWDSRMDDIFGRPLKDPARGYEHFASCLHPEDRGRVRAEVEATVAGEATFDTDFRVIHPEGRIRVIRARGEVYRDATGTPIRMIGVNWDITRERAHEEARILHGLVETLAAADGLDEVLPAVLERVCDGTKWRGGEAWMPEDGALVLRHAWWQPDRDPLSHAGDDTLRLGCGEGLPGECWEAGKVVWMDALAENQRFARAAEAEAAGVHAGVAVPVLDPRDQVVAVLAFFMERGAPEDRRTKRLVSTVARQLRTAVARKIAEEETLESERRFRATFDQAAVGMAHVAPGGSFLRVNDRLCEMLGTDRETLLGLGPEEVTHPADREADHDRQRKLVAGEIPHYSVEKRLRGTGGRSLWALITMAMVRAEDATAPFVAAVVEDVTERRRTEDELRRSNKELEQFAYVASHDLQEPLRTVTSYVQLLDDRYGEGLDDRAGKYMGYIVEGARRMQALINDLLKYSRMGRNELDLEPVDLSTLMGDAASDLGVAIAEADAEIRCGDLPTVLADRTLLGVVLQNLLSNAIKFRGEEPPVVEVTAERRGDEWLVSVCDNGIGMEPEYLERIFTIFQRLHGRDEYPGTGMGLAICRKIVERHGGRIWAASEPGAGTAFQFTLPAGNGEEEG